MTLIVTAGCPDFIVQISDRRFIDLKDGRTITDEGNKALVVRASDADFSIGFTGLAQIQGQLTSDWLVDQISKAKAPEQGFDACVEAVRIAAERAFDRIVQTLGLLYPHIFVFAGFHRESDQPAIVAVSNCESENFRLTAPTPNFISRTRPLHRFPYHQAGYTPAMVQDSKAKIKGMIRRTDSYPTMTDLIVQEIRKAAGHKTYGMYVGEQCMSVCVRRSGQVESVYYPTHGKLISHAPNLIEALQPEQGQGHIILKGVSFGGGLYPITLGQRRGGVVATDRRLLGHLLTADENLQRGLAFGHQGRHREALTSFQRALELQPNHPEALYSLSIALTELGSMEEALAALDHLILLFPDYHNAHYNRGVILAKLGRQNEALAASDRALDFRTDDPRVHNNRGAALHILGRYEEALAAYDRSLQLRPDDPDTHYNRGTALNRLGRYRKALPSFDRAIQLRPDHHQTLCNRATTLQGLRQYKEALRDNDRAIELCPNDPMLIASRAITLHWLGRLEDALADANRALELDPENADALYEHACLYSLWSKPDEALEDLQRAISINLAFRELARTDSDFENIRDDPRFGELVGEDEPSPEGGENS